MLSVVGLVSLPRIYIEQVAEGAKVAGASRIIGIDIDSNKFERGTYQCCLLFSFGSIRFWY